MTLKEARKYIKQCERQPLPQDKQQALPQDIESAVLELIEERGEPFVEGLLQRAEAGALDELLGKLVDAATLSDFTAWCSGASLKDLKEAQKQTRGNYRIALLNELKRRKANGGQRGRR